VSVARRPEAIVRDISASGATGEHR
jgi:hypothetical protein